MTEHQKLMLEMNTYLLESDHQLYYQNLVKRTNEKNARYLTDIMNDTTSFHSFNSPAIIQLAYMVGDLGLDWSELAYLNFYGKNSSISDDEGCRILDAMLLAGADIYVENFYEENLLECLKHTHTLTTRKNNEKFKLKVEKLFQTTPRPDRKGKGRNVPPPPPAAPLAG